MVKDKKQGFARDKRLTCAKEYSYVFAEADRFGNFAFTVLARENEVGHPRLGLAISKKSVKRSVDRSKIKRIVRESFRREQATLPAVDLVVMCRTKVLTLDNAAIFRQLDKIWKNMRKKLHVSLPSGE